MNEDFLLKRLQKRIEQNTLRQLPKQRIGALIDFASNDYLGLAKHTHNTAPSTTYSYGSTGSRLISGNHSYFEKAEKMLCQIHHAESALIFNSGYDANLGLLSALGHREDTFIYDEYIHASLRDGIRLSIANSFFFRHNDMEDLSKKISLCKGRVFIVTESIFSMDGDEAPLQNLIHIAQKTNAYLILDEAHSLGWYEKKGLGMADALGFEKNILARVLTFGKGLGCHGSAVLGSQKLIDYLVNFSRSFIYTTALPEESIATILHNYERMLASHTERKQLYELIAYFKQQEFLIEKLPSHSPIQGLLLGNVTKVKSLAQHLQENGFFCLPILSPTVPEGTERIRITLHTFNTKEDIDNLVKVCNTWAKKNI